MPNQLLIFPFGGNGRESLVTILDSNNNDRVWDVVGFIDDDSSTWGKKCCGVEVIGGKDVLENIEKKSFTYVLAVPGNPDNYLRRKEIIENLHIEDSRYPKIIHSSVTISPDAIVGYNTVIMPNVVISCGVKIGNHCVILPNSVISHDSIIGDYCCIGSQVVISGHVTVGSNCYIASGARIRDNISIGERTLVGLGSNVINDIGEGLVIAGNPAGVIRKVI